MTDSDDGLPNGSGGGGGSVSGDNGSLGGHATIGNSGQGSAQSSLLTQGVGTPSYMSPEALNAEQYSQATDVWSFGVLLWEIAAQAPPDLLAQARRPLPWHRCLSVLKFICRFCAAGSNASVPFLVSRSSFSCT